MISLVQLFLNKLISFLTHAVKITTLFATLVGVLVCFFLFFYYLFSYQLSKALLTLMAMITFVAVNKQY